MKARFVYVVLDSEYVPRDDGKLMVVCIVAKNLETGETKRIWMDQLSLLHSQPLFSENEVWVVYSALAELHALGGLGAKIPKFIVDLMVEYRNLVNGTDRDRQLSLLEACKAYGIPTMGEYKKEAMRQLILSGGPYTIEQKFQILTYCEQDVVLTEKLFLKIKDKIRLSHALLRGDHLRSCFEIELIGIPIDIEKHAEIQEKRDLIRERLIAELDAGFGFYDKGVFKRDRFASWVSKKEIQWPHSAKGAIRTDDNTIKEMCRIHFELTTFRELKSFLSVTRKSGITLGADGRNRTGLRPFSSKTSRNQPSSTEAIFGNSSWSRSLIKPPKGYAIAYLDYRQQEFGIGGALSGDANKKHSYLSGDPYLEFAKLAKAVPKDASKKTHKKERDQFKLCALAVQYGMSFQQLAVSANISEIAAKELLLLHRNIYQSYWKWSDKVVDHYTLKGFIATRFGWRLNYKPGFNERSVRNFLMQANGSEILRIALRLMLDSGIKVCAPVHDAVLIESRIENIEHDVLRAKQLMGRASEIVLDGFSLGTDVKIVKFPDRYFDERGETMWGAICRLMAEVGVINNNKTCNGPSRHL